MKANRHAVWIYGLVLALVAGCAQLGAPTPQSTEQGIAYLYPAIGVVADETAGLLSAGKIRKSEAQNVLTILEQLRALTNTARDYVKAGDEGKAASTLTLARGLLKQAQDFVTQRKGT